MGDYMPSNNDNLAPFIFGAAIGNNGLFNGQYGHNDYWLNEASQSRDAGTKAQIQSIESTLATQSTQNGFDAMQNRLTQFELAAQQNHTTAMLFAADCCCKSQLAAKDSEIRAIEEARKTDQNLANQTAFQTAQFNDLSAKIDAASMGNLRTLLDQNSNAQILEAINGLGDRMSGAINGLGQVVISSGSSNGNGNGHGHGGGRGVGVGNN